MTINLFEQARIDGILENLKPPTTFLMDTFFMPEDIVHDTNKIVVDLVVEGMKIAPLVTSDDDPIIVGGDGYSTNIVQAPKILLDSPLKPKDFLDYRQPGEIGITKTSSNDFIKRATTELARRLKKLRNMRVRMMEWMAAQALLDGKWEITIPQTGRVFKVDFKRPADHTVVLVGTDKWDDHENADPLAKIDEKAGLVKDGVGMQPTHVVMNSVTRRQLMSCKKFLAALETRRANRGMLDTTSKELLAIGAKKFAEIDSYEFWEYDGVYEDLSGNKKKYVPDGNVLLAGKFSGNVKNYGPIENFYADNPSKIEFARNYVDNSGRNWTLSYESNPLLTMNRPQAAVKLVVL